MLWNKFLQRNNFFSETIYGMSQSDDNFTEHTAGISALYSCHMSSTGHEKYLRTA